LLRHRTSRFLHSLRSVEMTTHPIRSASAGIIVVCVIPSAAEESLEQKPQPREIPPLRATRSGRNDKALLDRIYNTATHSGACRFALEGACAKTASCARHLDWREPATAMERSSLLRHRASRFLHSLRSVEMTTLFWRSCDCCIIVMCFFSSADWELTMQKSATLLIAAMPAARPGTKATAR